MRWALLVAALVLAGCASSPAGQPGGPPQPPPTDLKLASTGDPTFTPSTSPSGFDIDWPFSGTWTKPEPSGTLSLWLDVKKYGRDPAGDAFANATFAPGVAQPFAMRTPFLGIGDYYYKLDARDASGTLVGRTLGVWETCAAALDRTAQQC